MLMQTKTVSTFLTLAQTKPAFNFSTLIMKPAYTLVIMYDAQMSERPRELLVKKKKRKKEKKERKEKKRKKI